MAGTSEATERNRRDALLLSLTFATGAVDVQSYLGLGGIFTANMTGNTIFLAIAFGQLNVGAAVRSGVAIAGFAVGAYAAGRWLEPSKDPGAWPPVVTRVLAVELAFSGAFAIGWAVSGAHPAAGPTFLLIALSATGMGLQSAVGRRLAVPSLTTNVLTMAMTGLMAELAAVGISGPNVRRWTFAILSMAAGAALGAFLFLALPVYLPLLPFGVLLVVVGVAATEGGTRASARSPVLPA